MKNSSTIFLKIVLLFIIAQGLSGTVLGQNSLPDSCICYTDTMDKQAIECLVNAPRKDSIIANQSLQLVNLTDRIKGKDIIIGDNKKTIEELSAENQKINLHLTQARRNVKIFGFAGIGIGVIGTMLLQK